MRTAVILASLLVFSGAANALEWSEWRQIAENESGFAHEAVPGGPALEIERFLSTENGGARREEWSWGSGQMVAVNAGPGRYLERNTKKFLRDYVAAVADAEGMEISITNSDIHRNHNKMGNYSYAEVQIDDPNVACFFFVQYFGNASSAGYSGSAGMAARGFLRGLDCQSTATAAADAHEGSMHLFLEGLSRQ